VIAHTDAPFVGRWGYHFTKKDEERFWGQVDRTTTPDGCWPFIGARDGHEYGVISWGGRTRGAHQVALELAGYIIPAKFLRVRHYVCHNPPCCRPSHLRIGTPQEDADDKVAADRQQRGEYAGCAKLDPVKVDEIYRLYEAGDTTEEVLALQFGVTRWAINRILRGKGWKHLGLDPIHVVLGSRAAQGERNGNAKLDPAKVREIRQLYLAAAPRHGLRAQLARQFDTTLQNINNIINGKTWRHVV
jgi:hypothetical protein